MKSVLSVNDQSYIAVNMKRSRNNEICGNFEHLLLLGLNWIIKFCYMKNLMFTMYIITVEELRERFENAVKIIWAKRSLLRACTESYIRQATVSVNKTNGNNWTYFVARSGLNNKDFFLIIPSYVYIYLSDYLKYIYTLVVVTIAL